MTHDDVSEYGIALRMEVMEQNMAGKLLETGYTRTCNSVTPTAPFDIRPCLHSAEILLVQIVLCQTVT